MKKQEILDKLWRTKVGDRVVVDGQSQEIIERVVYEEHSARWLNLVFLGSAGEEIAIEVEGKELSLWPEIDVDFDIIDSIEYEGEKYTLTESGTPRTVSTTEDGEEKNDTPYWVYTAPSGRRLAIEIWDGKKYFYLAETKTPAISF